MTTNYKLLIERLEYSIFGSPSQAIGIDGWMKHGNTMQTRCRPDGSVSSRPDKTVLKFVNDALFLSYNGASFKSGYVRGLLKKKYGDGWMKTVCKMYGITTEDYSSGTFTPRDYKTATRPKPYTIGDESKVDSIPQAIVSLTYDRTRPDVLRDYLCRTFGETATLQAWEKYRVGDGFGGQTLFWNYDRQGRCRCGKNMCYHSDGHRDKSHTISIGYELKDLGHISKDLKLVSCLYGEHILAQYPNLPVGLVESEKTAIVSSIFYPELVWVATGGATQNLDRAIAILKGRKGVIFPDADAYADWKDKFSGLRGFTVNDYCFKYFQEKGEKWSKCDLCDILIEEYHKEA